MFNKIKYFILNLIAQIINKYNTFFNVKEIYSLSKINSNKLIVKNTYSLFYFNLLYVIYYLNLFKLFNLLYYFKPFKNELYVIVIKYNNFLYKLFINNEMNDSLYFILNYKNIFKLNDDLDMKILKCKCYTLDKPNEFFDININNYYINNYYQSIQNILYDININHDIYNYILISQIYLYDILLDEIVNTYDVISNYDIPIVNIKITEN